MWKKNIKKKIKGLYDDYAELDKNTPVKNSANNKNVLSDRFGFYNRDVNNNKQMVDEIGKENMHEIFAKNDNEIIKKYVKPNTINKTSNNIVNNISSNTVEKSNMVRYQLHLNAKNTKKIEILEKKIIILNENIKILNEKLNLIKDQMIQSNHKKISDNNYTLDDIQKASKKMHQSFLQTQREKQFNTNNNIYDNISKQKYNDINFNIKKDKEYYLKENNSKNIHDVILNAKEKNNILKKINEKDEQFLENSIKKRVDAKNDDEKNPYYHLRQKLINQNNNTKIFFKNKKPLETD